MNRNFLEEGISNKFKYELVGNQSLNPKKFFILMSLKIDLPFLQKLI